MLWLNRPYAGQESELRVVNEDGRCVALVIVRTGSEVEIEVQRLEDDPTMRVVIP